MNNVGCAPQYFDPAFAAAYGGAAGLPLVAPAFPMTGPLGWSIVGADNPPAQPSMLDKLKAYGNETTFGVANKWLGAAAVVTALTWYGYHEGWFGKKR